MLCERPDALLRSIPQMHSGPNHPLCGPITLPHFAQCFRSGGVGGFGILPEYSGQNDTGTAKPPGSAARARQRPPVPFWARLVEIHETLIDRSHYLSV